MLETLFLTYLIIAITLRCLDRQYSHRNSQKIHLRIGTFLHWFWVLLPQCSIGHLPIHAEGTEGYHYELDLRIRRDQGPYCLHWRRGDTLPLSQLIPQHLLGHQPHPQKLSQKGQRSSSPPPPENPAESRPWPNLLDLLQIPRTHHDPGLQNIEIPSSLTHNRLQQSSHLPPWYLRRGNSWLHPGWNCNHRRNADLFRNRWQYWRWSWDDAVDLSGRYLENATISGFWHLVEKNRDLGCNGSQV